MRIALALSLVVGVVVSGCHAHSSVKALGPGMNPRREANLREAASRELACPNDQLVTSFVEWQQLDESGQPELSAARERIVANFDHELQLLNGIEHSAWAAFNSVSQYVDWERPTRGFVGKDRDERRFASSMFGQGADLKRRAWSTALELAGVR